MGEAQQVGQVTSDRAGQAGGVEDPARAFGALTVPAARMLAVEILLADPETLGDDVLESCLYLLREKLRAPAATSSE